MSARLFLNISLIDSAVSWPFITFFFVCGVACVLIPGIFWYCLTHFPSCKNQKRMSAAAAAATSAAYDRLAAKFVSVAGGWFPVSFPTVLIREIGEYFVYIAVC